MNSRFFKTEGNWSLKWKINDILHVIGWIHICSVLDEFSSVFTIEDAESDDIE